MTRVSVKRKVLKENDRIAEELRTLFRSRNVLTLNIISSPGAGKTSLLEQSLHRLPAGIRTAVLTGDIETDNDAKRLSPFGRPVRQITTGGACHLDAHMVETGFSALGRPDVDVLFIENVGNLVCPASFDLGEASKIVVLSVTEGDDKPLKYPATFVRADLVILNKTDLLPYVSFSVAHAKANANKVHPGVDILEVSCKTGAGIDEWLTWIRKRLDSVRAVSGRS